MDISFVILAWDSEEYISRCLDSILSTSDGFSYEIFVVDNGSTDRTSAILASFQTRYPEKFTAIMLPQNRGTTYSRNLALKSVQGNYICILDSDVELKSGTVKHLMQVLKKNPGIGLVAPKLLYPDGRIQKSTDRFPTAFSKLFRYLFLKWVEKKMQTQALQISEVDYAISALWLFRKTLLDEVGLLDENIFYSPEDVDYCLSIWKSGYKIVYDPNAVAIHHTQEISRGMKLNRAKFDHIAGLIYYFKKHRYVFRSPLFSV